MTEPNANKNNSPVDRQRVWVLSELYYPEETSTGYYLTKIAEGLADEFDVSVICGQPNYSAKGTIAPRREFHKGVNIIRARGTTLDKNVIPFRVLNMISLSFSVLFAALKNFKRGDKVLVVTTPPLLPFTAMFAALVKGAATYLLIHDNYPEILVAVGKTRENSRFARLMEFANRWLYKYAAKIIVVGRDMAELIKKKTFGLDIPIDYIPNWAELETVEPRPRQENELLRSLGLADKFVLLYAGNMGHPNDMESIVEAARNLQQREDIHFLFLGTGVKRSWLEAEKNNGLDNITIIDPRPRSEQIEFLNACDAGIVSLISKMKGVSMPSRTYNILAAGKPILAISDAGSEIDLVVNDDDVGFRVSPGNADSLAEAIVQMASDRERLDEMGQSARTAALERYSLDAAVQAYKAALR